MFTPGPPHTLLVHTSVLYGLQHLEEDKEEVGKDIMKHVHQLLPWLPQDEQLIIKSHKWRYSQVSQSCSVNFSSHSNYTEYFFMYLKVCSEHSLGEALAVGITPGSSTTDI